MFLALTSISTISQINQIHSKFLDFKGYKFFYPLSYFFGFFGYCIYSQLYSLEDPELGDDYKMIPERALTYMYICLVSSGISILLAVISAFPCQTELESPLLDENE